MQITNELSPAAADRRVIAEAIQAYGLAKIGDESPANIASFLRSAGAIVGGACGRVVRGRLLLDLLWVKEELRNAGNGTKLLAAIEALARTKHGHDIILETFDEPRRAKRWREAPDRWVGT